MAALGLFMFTKKRCKKTEHMIDRIIDWNRLQRTRPAYSKIKNSTKMKTQIYKQQTTFKKVKHTYKFEGLDISIVQ